MKAPRPQVTSKPAASPARQTPEVCARAASRGPLPGARAAASGRVWLVYPQCGLRSGGGTPPALLFFLGSLLPCEPWVVLCTFLGYLLQV